MRYNDSRADKMKATYKRNSILQDDFGATGVA
jgi:hypothetical protein